MSLGHEGLPAGYKSNKLAHMPHSIELLIINRRFYDLEAATQLPVSEGNIHGSRRHNPVSAETRIRDWGDSILRQCGLL
jgi:hypothetical protein